LSLSRTCAEVLIIEEKLDGANTGISFDPDGNLAVAVSGSLPGRRAG